MSGTYVSLAACIGNGIRIRNIIEEHLDSYLAKVEDNIILAHPTKQLHGAEVTAGEIRAGACLMIAGLIANGTTIIDKAGNILRGYDRVQEKLRQLGADVKIVDNPDEPGVMDKR